MEPVQSALPLLPTYWSEAFGRSCSKPAKASAIPFANGATFNCSRPGNTTSTAPQNACSQRTGWNSPEPDQYPTGTELVDRYLEPFATKTALAAHIRTSSHVTDISRVGFDKLKTKGREAAPFEFTIRMAEVPKSCEPTP